MNGIAVRSWLSSQRLCSGFFEYFLEALGDSCANILRDENLQAFKRPVVLSTCLILYCSLRTMVKDSQETFCCRFAFEIIGWKNPDVAVQRFQKNELVRFWYDFFASDKDICTFDATDNVKICLLFQFTNFFCRNLLFIFPSSLVNENFWILKRVRRIDDFWFTWWKNQLKTRFIFLKSWFWLLKHFQNFRIIRQLWSCLSILVAAMRISVEFQQKLCDFDLIFRDSKNKRSWAFWSTDDVKICVVVYQFFHNLLKKNAFMRIKMGKSYLEISVSNSIMKRSQSRIIFVIDILSFIYILHHIDQRSFLARHLKRSFAKFRQFDWLFEKRRRFRWRALSLS